MPMFKITHKVDRADTVSELLDTLKDEEGFMVAVPAKLVFTMLGDEDIHLTEAKDYPDSIQAFLQKTNEVSENLAVNKTASGTLLTGLAVRKNKEAAIKFRLGSYAIDESNAKIADVGYYLLAKCPPGSKASAGELIETPNDLPDNI